MAEHSSIEWTDATWNPIIGCSVVSPGCTNCYAMRMARRLELMQAMTLPLGQCGHYAGMTKVVNGNPVWTGKVALAQDRILTQPLRWKKPRKVFVNSMSDLFHEGVPDEWIDRVFAVMALCPQHTFQVLTKRPERMRNYIGNRWAHLSAAAERIGFRIMEMMPDEEVPYPEHWGVTASSLIHGPTPEHPLVVYPRPDLWPLPNVWIGTSCEDQKRADERIPLLLDTPAAIRFVSAEPLLGQIRFDRINVGQSGVLNALTGRWASYPIFQTADGPVIGAGLSNLPALQQIIVGGESGPNARPMHPDWARSIRDQCAATDVPFLFKQWGEWIPIGPAYPEEIPGATEDQIDDWELSIMEAPGNRSGKICCMTRDGSFPVDYRFSGEYQPPPNSGSWWLVRYGKKAAGRLLDGVEHNGYPEVRPALPASREG